MDSDTFVQTPNPKGMICHWSADRHSVNTERLQLVFANIPSALGNL